MTDIQFYATTEDNPWFTPEQAPTIEDMRTFPGAFLRLDQPQQVIDGFGVCFNELGWVAMSKLSEEDRTEFFRQIFAPGVGANLSTCRMPVGANDFATDWYSYDEVDGDYALEHFSIEHDDATLVPYIKAAKAQNPELTLWASPWGPPSWFKRNKHYACAAPNPMSEQTNFDNGLSPDNQIEEGTDGLILTDEVLDTYARYFGKFIDEYRARGIDISMVMPQNEFNSAQIYPACTWTPEGLIKFLRRLIPEMDKRGVEVFFGTMERPDDTMVERVLADSEVGPRIKGVGFQWDGKKAVPFIHHNHPELKIYQSEQECGDGRNDWRYARYAWTMMRHYFQNGASVYDYWNMALQEGGVSRWGWSQNSLVVVDPETGTGRFSYEYYVLKHLSGYVQQGARYISPLSYTGYENILAFHNPDGSVVIAAQNDMTTPQEIVVGVGRRNVSFTAPADSIVTVVVPAEEVEVASKPLA